MARELTPAEIIKYESMTAASEQMQLSDLYPALFPPISKKTKKKEVERYGERE